MSRALLWIPRTLRRYLKEVQRLLAEVAFGSGGLGVIGGTIGVMIAMTLFTGTVVGLQGYAALNQIGTAAFTGFVSAYFNTREIAPLVAGLALSATVGAGFTAQLGAMRINEEIDALEGMGIRSLPYLVTTRIIAGVVAIIPLYAIGLLSSYFASRLTTVVFKGQSRGTFDHYFNLFLSPTDVLLSVLKVLIFSVMVILAHCYYGFRASGRPGRCRRRGGPLGPQRDRADRRHRLLPLARHLGRHHHREGGRMNAPTVRRRLAGVVFLLVPALLVWLSIAVYDKDFTRSDTVTVLTSSVGNEMHRGAEVKLRGVVVGEVRAISADGDGARLTLALQPGQARPHPVRRPGADAADHPVRRAVRGARAARRTHPRERSQPMRPSPRTGPATPSSWNRSSTTSCRCSPPSSRTTLLHPLRRRPGAARTRHRARRHLRHPGRAPEEVQPRPARRSTPTWCSSSRSPRPTATPPPTS